MYYHATKYYNYYYHLVSTTNNGTLDYSKLRVSMPVGYVTLVQRAERDMHKSGPTRTKHPQQRHGRTHGEPVRWSRRLHSRRHMLIVLRGGKKVLYRGWCMLRVWSGIRRCYLIYPQKFFANERGGMMPFVHFYRSLFIAEVWGILALHGLGWT